MPTTVEDLLTTESVAANRARISKYIIQTPVMHLRGPAVERRFGSATELFLKLETFQPTGSFKVRSVITFLLSLDEETRQKGLYTLSAGNHAAAVAYAASRLGTTAKVIMPRGTNPYKIDLSARYGADVVFIDDFSEAGALMREIEATEEREFVPAWGDSRLMLGTASIALDLFEQVPRLDAFLVAIGGGSVCAGAGTMVKRHWPDCSLFASEPEGAPTMLRSFRSGQREHLEKSTTIAEGLAPPESCEYFTAICKQNVDDLSPVSDHDIVAAMRFLFEEAKLAIEPSGAGALAGAFGPYKERISGRRVGVVVSGSNIDFGAFRDILDAPEYSA